MYEAKGILPDELARQNPVMLFKILISESGNSKPSMDNVPDNLKWFYGY